MPRKRKERKKEWKFKERWDFSPKVKELVKKGIDPEKFYKELELRAEFDGRPMLTRMKPEQKMRKKAKRPLELTDEECEKIIDRAIEELKKRDEEPSKMTPTRADEIQDVYNKKAIKLLKKKKKEKD